MVTQTTENGRQKCARYWPSSPEPIEGCSAEGCTIEMTEEADEVDGVIERTLVLKSKRGERRLRQIQFVDWPDHGVPHDPSHFLVFLRKVRAYREAITDESPTIVHCSAGVGRTGVTIALDAAASKLEKNLKIDPASLLTEMRRQRGCLIQEKGQQ